MRTVDEAYARFSEFLELIPDATIASTADGTIVLANAEASEVFGYSHEQLLKMKVFDLVPERLHERLQRDRTDFFQNPVRRTIGLDEELPLRRADGSEIPVEVTLSSADSPHGPLRIAAVRDISERVNAELERERLAMQVELDQARRMESIGQLAGGIAHDFNNLLGVIINYADFAALELDDLPEVRDDVEQIKAAALRASSLTRQLLIFSRREVDDRRPLQLNEVLEDLEKLLRRVLGEHVELETRFDPELWTVEADAGQIEHVVINLAVNARDAMPSGGKLAIETSNVSLDAEYAASHADAPQPGSYVRLTVADSGSGMDRETMARALEPFFTTKPKPQGTGLGLATVYGTVKSHGGNIFLYSEPGEGTSVKIHLPACDRPAGGLGTDGGETAAGGSGERVLVVEDEDAVRRMVIRVLETNGYEVVECSRGRDALTRLEEPAEDFSLMLTDVVMPEMQGAELAERAAEIRPGLPILFMSGYSDLSQHKFDPARDDIDLLQKPFTVNDLLKETRRMIDTRKEAK